MKTNYNSSHKTDLTHKQVWAVAYGIAAQVTNILNT